jgi:hypothetical protein
VKPVHDSCFAYFILHASSVTWLVGHPLSN